MTSLNTIMDSHRAPDFVSDSELHALLDGRLSLRERAALETRLAKDGLASATLNAWQTQREELRKLHQPLLNEPLPPTLLAAAQRAIRTNQQLDQCWRWGGMAASVMLAFGIGWLSHGHLGGQLSQQIASGQMRSAQAFVQQASLAHAVFSPEVRHPVEVTAAQQEHLVQWLSKRLGKPLKVPVLAAQAYELVGGRLLPGDGGARAQLMFQNPEGMRVTLYLGALDDKIAASGAAPKPASQETAFRYSTDGPVPSFYWVDQGFGYALSSAVSREELLKLAQLVYEQL